MLQNVAMQSGRGGKGEIQHDPCDLGLASGQVVPHERDEVSWADPGLGRGRERRLVGDVLPLSNRGE